MDLCKVIVFAVCASALENECGSGADETCLLQVKSDMKLGKEREGIAGEAGVTDSYECWPSCAPKCPEACGSMGGYFTKPVAAAPVQPASQPCAQPAQPAQPVIDPAKPVVYATGPAQPASQKPCAVPNKMWEPVHQKCTPMCKWDCTRPECEQSCKPICAAPKCQTRCNGYNITNCHMECETPHCAVICPDKGCPNGDCPLCTTQCTKACCKMQCDPGEQPCENICEQPECTWECHAPEACPQPECKLTCEAPTGCKGTIHEKLPPLNAGQCAVNSFEPQKAVGTAGNSLLDIGHMVTHKDGAAKVRVSLEVMKSGATKSSAMPVDLPVAPTLIQKETPTDPGNPIPDR